MLDVPRSCYNNNFIVVRRRLTPDLANSTSKIQSNYVIVVVRFTSTGATFIHQRQQTCSFLMFGTQYTQESVKEKKTRSAS